MFYKTLILAFADLLNINMLTILKKEICIYAECKFLNEQCKDHENVLRYL